MDWADEVENDDGEDSGIDVDMILPPFDRVVKDGFVYEISYQRLDDGRVIRRSRKNEKKRRQKRIPRAAIARRQVPKFGACAGQERGVLEKNITEANYEEASFHWTYTDTMKEERDNMMMPQQRTGGKGFPKINLPERRIEMKVGEQGDAAEPTQKFRPRSDRAMDGGFRQSMAQESYELRISNVPFQTEKAHVYELIEGVIGRFARTDENRPRVKERTRGEDEKHFYVQFKEAQHAVDVMHTLNGYHYGHMVMLVEWSRQSKKPESKLQPSQFVASGRGRGRRGDGGGGYQRRGGFRGGGGGFRGGGGFSSRPRGDDFGGDRGGGFRRGRGRGDGGDRGRGRGTLSSRGRGFSARPRGNMNSARDGSNAPRGPSRRGGYR